MSAQQLQLPTAAKRGAAAPVVATARDVALLRLVGEQCALTQPQLARALGRSLHTARWLRGRWQRAGWVRAGQLVPGGAVSVWLTARGQALAGVDYRLWRPQQGGRLAHIAHAAEARLYVAGRHPDAVWVCERELLRRWRREGLQLHRPDAEVVTSRGTAAVEVELTLKGRRRFELIAVDLSARYRAVWYFAPPTRVGGLSERIERAGLGRCHVVALADPWKAP